MYDLSVAEKSHSKKELVEVCKRNLKNVAVLRAALLNKHLPAVVVNKLAKHKDWRVRVYVAINGKLSIDNLEMLSEDSENVVTGLVGINPNCPTDILRKCYREGREELIAEHKNLDEETRWKIIRNGTQLAKLRLIQNPNLTKEEVLELAYDIDRDICWRAHARYLEDWPDDAEDEE